MLDTVLGWGAVAIFVGPVVAAIALVGLRWLFNRGLGMPVILAALLGWAAYYYKTHPH